METPPSFSTQYQMQQPPPPHRVRFDAIGEGWKLFMADFGQWFLAVFLFLLVTAAVGFVIRLLVLALAFGSTGFDFMNPQSTSAMRTANIVGLLAAVPVSAFSLMLQTSLQRRGVLQLRGAQPTLGELLDYQGMGGSLYLWGLVYALAGLPISLFFVLMSDSSRPFWMFQPAVIGGLCALGFLSFVVQMLVLFTGLVIVDQRLTMWRALRVTFGTFLPVLLPLVGVSLCAVILAGLGVFACCIGLLFTMPLWYCYQGVVYNDFFRPEPANGSAEDPWYPRPPV